MRGEREIVISRISGGELSSLTDVVCVEEQLVIFVNGREYASLQYSPPMAVELAVGYLASEGAISSMQDIRSLSLLRDGVFIEINRTLPDIPRAERVTITSGCGGAHVSRVVDALKYIVPVEPGFTIDSERIFLLSDIFRKKSELFERTGGVHSAGVAAGAGFLAFADDIGRHNAVDKVLGGCLIDCESTSGSLLMITGRVSSDILIKAARRSVPVVASRSAPTALAVDYATRLGITLIGFLRGRRMNIYSRPERIIHGNV